MRTANKLALIQPQSKEGEKFGDPSKASVLAISELSRNPYEGNTTSRERIHPGFGANAQINTGPYTTVQVTVPFAGSGKAGVPPAYAPLLQACGLKETITEAKPAGKDKDGKATSAVPGKVTYTPISSNYKRVNFWYYYDGEVQQLVDVLATAQISCTAGGLPTIQFTLTGLYNKPKKFQAGSYELQNQADEIPVNKQNTPTFNVVGHETIAQSFALDLGNTVSYQNLINYEGIDITARAAKGDIQVKAVSVETADYFALMESHKKTTTGELRFVHGTEDGNIIEYHGFKAQMSGFSEQDQDGELHYKMTANYLPTDKGADNEFELIYR
ncbi:phage tail tube protein [Carnimonas bestiolae]|uniref:phage tail tube protein n=1 Tax=Carnimonas bestiolae TaxID=3402172 RepID=UPI003EDC18C1